ncbi:MAG: 30S ribosomal protein S27ae [Crenarchaeota archaeon]|nr:30S ribosomal protein S27ae [Thermoproteota archaeon]
MGKQVKARAHTWYEVDYNTGTIKFLRRFCPRCGSVMAYHKTPVPRWHCGKCSYTIFEVQQPQATPREKPSRRK